MAKIKPTNSNKPIVGFGTKLDAFGAACDVVGMTDIPGVSQGAELISAGISVATGDYIGAALSVGSMIPIAGKAAEAAKVAHKAKRVADGVSTAQKEAKLLTITARKADDFADVAKQSNNLSSSTPKPAPPQPSKTQAKSAKKQPEKEIMDETSHFDSDEWLGLSERTPAGDSIFSNSFSSNRPTDINIQKYNYSTNSNPVLNNKFQSTGKPLRVNFGI